MCGSEIATCTEVKGCGHKVRWELMMCVECGIIDLYRKGLCQLSEISDFLGVGGLLREKC